MNKKNEEKTLLIVIGGKAMRGRYMTYKWEIKQKYQARQVKPYALEFPRKLDKEEIEHIKKVLKNVKYEIFTISELVFQKLTE